MKPQIGPPTKVSGFALSILAAITLTLSVGLYVIGYVVLCEQHFHSVTATAGGYVQCEVRLYRGESVATLFKPAAVIHGVYLGMPIQTFPADDDD